MAVLIKLKLMSFKIIILIGALCGSGCGISQVDNYSIIRDNFFDSSKYHLSIRDTNKVNKYVFESIFRTVKLENNSKFILMSIADTAFGLTEYGLYDFQSSKYYYGIGKGGNLHFTTLKTPESEMIYSRINNIIQAPKRLLDYVKGNSPKSDQELSGVTFEANEILIDKPNKRMLIKSYRW